MQILPLLLQTTTFSFAGTHSEFETASAANSESGYL